MNMNMNVSINFGFYVSEFEWNLCKNKNTSQYKKEHNTQIASQTFNFVLNNLAN